MTPRPRRAVRRRPMTRRSRHDPAAATDARSRLADHAGTSFWRILERRLVAFSQLTLELDGPRCLAYGLETSGAHNQNPTAACRAPLLTLRPVSTHMP